ncbi:MAG: family 78 glycoside hydrolase catalytic domain [Bacteroidota bacterium]|nr:family 78 glycoside hydrolase catalytic domain [Bacteroidota bacterium]
MIKLKYTLVFLAIFFTVNLFAQNVVSISEIRCESKFNPLGIEVKYPRLSWSFISSERDMQQSAYHILVADSQEKLQKNIGNIWDSKVVNSDRSIQVEYAGVPLNSEKKYFWKVKVWNQAGIETNWSETGSWQMGLLSANDWGKAIWIGLDNLPDSMKVVPGVHGLGDELGNRAVKRTIVPLFRKEFEIQRNIKSATLYICGLGQYEATINGQKVSQDFLSPGWTNYDKTCLYNTYDVTVQLKQGKNVLGVIVGNGFYNINRERYRKLVIAYGYPQMISKLMINYTDGTTKTIVSGSDWKCSSSPIIFTSIYGGEDYDATIEQKGWNQAGFDDAAWKMAVPAEIPSGKLTAESDYPVKVREVVDVKKIEQPQPGKYLYDFGQNCSGIIELKVSGEKGSVVKLTPGELITKDRTINQSASGSPYYYSYTLKGEGIEIWKPRFSYYGFRYVMVEGAAPESEKPNTGMPRIIGLQMLHTCNSAPKIGAFSCSNQLFNQIFQLIDWAIRSNLQSVITDCPHREKLGWLEQTYLMGASVHFNYDLHSLYRKVINDMIDSQTMDGLVPDIAPEYVPFQSDFRDSPEWGSAAVILPWMIWQWYGDRSVVEQAMPMMKKYVAYLGSKAKGHILSYGLGDWYDYGPKPPGEAQLTPNALTATAIYYYDIILLSKMMELMNNKEDAQKTAALGEEVKKAFNSKFFNDQTKVYSTGSQTAMSMPLCVGLVSEQDRKVVFNHLIESITNSGKSLTAGDIGFHFLVKALEERGSSQLLFDMNFRDDVPGYGFQLKKGATALTESWPALEVVSNNHLMLGHLMEWFYTGLGGIKQEENSVAFRNIIIRPEIVGDITHVASSYLSSYGLIKSEWEKEKNILKMNVEIPANTSATIYFPTTQEASVTESGKKAVVSKTADGKYFCKVGSGTFSFRMSYE